MTSGRARKVTACCGIIGLVLLVVGCVLITVFHNLIDNMVKEQIPLKKGSQTYDDWAKPPVPIYFQAYVFHLANPSEVVNNGDKPVLEQRGPYTYREHRQKVDIHEWEGNSSLSYREIRYFNFERGMSVGPESDVFVTANIPMVTIANLVRFEFPFIQELVELVLALANEPLFLPLSVGDILWGYEDSLLKDVKDILARYNISSPIDDRFGLFYKQNGSDDGWYNIYSGVADTTKFGIINSWNYETKLTFWTSDAANRINGTDGTIFPPFVTPDDVLYLFASDICRSVYVKYTEDASIHDIPLLRFVAPADMFANISVNPGNAGFCTPTTDNCLPSGVLNASACHEGAPIVLSQPNFLQADPKIINAVYGMAPDPNQHSTFLEIEPLTGVAMNVAKKLQLNIYLENVSHIHDTRNLHPLIFPILWINESATLDEKSADKFKSSVQMPVKITEAVQYGLITFGVFILICALSYGGRFLAEWLRGRSEGPDEQTSLLHA